MREEDTLEGNGFQFHLGSLALLADKLDVPGGGIPRTARVLHEYDHLSRTSSLPHSSEWRAAERAL